MKSNASGARSGRHFLQIPGPTNVPDRVLQAIAAPTIDHRGPDFAELGKDIVAGMKRVFQTGETVIVYPSSGTGAWEAALANTLSPGDRVLMFETGHFASLWRAMAGRLGLDIEFVPGDWRRGVDPALVEEKLAGRPRAPGEGGLRRPQRDLDRRCQPHSRDPRGDRPGRSPGLVHGRHDLVIGARSTIAMTNGGST